MGKSEHTLGTNNEWCSPQAAFKPVIDGWGKIDLDPFGNFNSRVPATKRVALPEKWEGIPEVDAVAYRKRGYIAGDARVVPWEGIVWVNGPYDACPWWLDRSAKAADDGAEVFALAPARPNNRWWDRYVWRQATAVCWPYDRIVFEGAKYVAPFHCAIIYYGHQVALFEFMYEHLGKIQRLG